MAAGSPEPLIDRSMGGVGQVRLLGPVDVVVGGEERAPGSRHARTMLAALAIRSGQVQSTDQLIAAAWGDDPPRTAAHALHVHASTLRRLLSDELRLIGRRGGYVLRTGPGQLDTDVFEDLAGRGRAELFTGRAAEAATLLRAALALWRGPILADVPWERFADGDAQRWTELRRTTAEDLTDAELATGRRPADLIGEIEALVLDQPFRERRWGQLMTALYAAGRQAEALDRYREVRAMLVEELGVEPSPHLRATAERILRQDPSLVREPAPAASGEPVTRYARGPAGRLAYQVLGDGPIDILFIPGFGGNVEIRWEEPNLARLYRRLARSGRLILMDKRGTGLSDRDRGVPPLEEQVDDVLAVLDTVHSERAVLLGIMDGGAIGLLTAARYPERVRAIVTYACFAAYELMGADADTLFAGLRAQLDRGLLFEEMLPVMAPDRADDPAFARWMGRYLRMAAGVGGAGAILDRFQELDIRPVLPAVTVPVLALHREYDRLIPAANAAYLAGQVRDGHAILLPGNDSVIWAGDVDAVAREIETFLARIGPVPNSPGVAG